VFKAKSLSVHFLLSAYKKMRLKKANNSQKKNTQDAVLPRSLYVTQKDPRASVREKVDAIFSDKFMFFLSVILVPLILVPFAVNLSDAELSFLEICDWVIVLMFVAEYVLKLYFATDRWKHFKSPWHIVDLVIVILPFVQYIPMLGLSITGSPSLLLRLLRLPRALAVGGRAVASRRSNGNVISSEIEQGPETIIRQVDSDLKATHNLSWDELKAHVADSARQEWLDLHYVSDEGFASLSRILEVAEPHFKSSVMDEIYPHIDYVQEASFIFVQLGEVKYPEFVENYFTISRSGIIVICNGTKIITVSRHNIDLMEDVINSVRRTKKNDTFVVPVLYGLLEHTLEEYKSLVSEIELEVLKIGGTPRSKLPKDFLERIYMFDKEVSRLVSNLVHFKDMLSIIITKKVPLEGFDKKWEETFHILQDSAIYLNEISHDLIENLRSIIDLYINQTSFETNKILKILAVVTTIGVIPSAAGGLLGTNLLDVPFGAYLWELSLITGITMSFVAYTFIKLGWLKT
jgi:Mg2+ and Co2+ transporter CorA